MIEIDEKIHSATHLQARFFLIIFGTIATFGTVFLLFAPFYAKNFMISGAILLTCLLTFGIVALFKCLIVFIHKLCKAKKSTQIRNQILIGLGGITICGIVPRILVFFLERDGYYLFCSFFSLSVISIALYYLFVYECDKNYEWVSAAKTGGAKAKVILSHFVVLILTIKLVSMCDFDSITTMKIISFQMWFGMFCAPNTFDLCVVLFGIRKMKNINEEEEPAGLAENVRQELVGVAKKTEEVPSSERETCKNQVSQDAQTHPKIDCKNCRLEYSDVLIPRILRECGHTLCELCVNTLQNTNQLQSLMCPFCKIVTAVNGPASMLQKNYEVLEIISDLKNWKYAHDDFCVDLMEFNG